MLIDHIKTFDLKSVSVKTAGALAFVVLAWPAMAQASSITKTAYTVRFEKSLTQSEAGVEKIYAMFEKKAKKACRFSIGVDEAGSPLTKEECIADMVEQLVKSADLAPVKAYHLKKTTEQG